MQLTPHYRLAAFEAGDQYSATWDRRRMVTIDNEMSFISVDMIGDGVIDGWGIQSTGGLGITVSAGDGIIEGFVTFTYSHLLGTVPDNRRSYVWMRRKADILGDRGAFSPMSQVVYTDTSPPGTPATPTGTATFDAVSLTWAANSEPDIGLYNLYRSSDGGATFTLLASVADTSYVDAQVVQLHNYQYKLTAEDVNGNVSATYGGTFSITTLPDTTVPADAANVEVNAADSKLQILWDASTDTIDHYQITVQPLDTEGLPNGTPFNLTALSTDNQLMIDSLTNGQRYQLTLYAVSAAGVLSRGVVVYGTPGFSPGPSGVTNVQVSDFSVDSSGDVALHITWDVDSNPYTTAPVYYFITVSQVGETAQPSIYATNDVEIVQYTLQGDQIESVVEDTNYNILIQAADANGNTEPGYRLRYHTHKYTPPAPPSNLVLDATFTTNESHVTASWFNSTSAFSYNLITVHRVSLDGNTANITIEPGTDIGQAQTYNVAQSLVVNNARYDFIIVAVDHDGNQSETLVGSVVLNTVFASRTTSSGQQLSNTPRPGVPDEQDAEDGNSVVHVRWNSYPSNLVANYNIYRANYADDFTPDMFSKVATVPPDVFEWNDYTVQNGTRYVYFVTVTDVFGQESLNPTDNFIDYPLSFASPRSHSTLDPAPAIDVQAVGYNGVLTWIPSGTDFDGYEVWRSNGNNYSFELVGDVQPDAEDYTDTNALVKNGTYYYMIRRVRNEAEIVVTTSNVAPVGAILLGSVIAANGGILLIQNLSNNIKNLHDPIVAETKRQLSVPHHMYISASDDRRVRIADELIVDDWTTIDFITYTTQQNIKETTTFTTLVNGDESLISSNIDPVNGILTFASAIFTPAANGSTTGAPAVTVVFANTSEVVGILPADQVANVSAVKVTRGLIGPARLTSYDHFGRYRELALPARVVLPYTDGYRFAGTLTDSMTFYDVYKNSDGQLIAATSRGIVQNDGLGGSIWNVLYANGTPATRIYYSTAYGWYMAILGDSVYYSPDLTNWAPIDGMKGVLMVHDIVEDSSGNIFSSTDAGVHRLSYAGISSAADASLKITWLQSSIINPDSPATYAIYFDSGTLIASTDEGLFESTDAGSTWFKSADAAIRVPLSAIIKTGSTFFAVSHTNLWRLRNGDSSYQIVFSTTSRCRKVSVFAGALYLMTDGGLLKTTEDLNNDTRFTLTPAFDTLERNGNIPAVTSLNVNDRLYLGTDNRLYSVTTDRSLLLHSDVAGPAPTIYVNGTERSVGVSYSVATVLFEEQLSPLDVVTVATTYQQLSTPFGGWVSVQYNAAMFVHLNGVLTGVGQPSALAKEILPSLTAIQLVTFNARNSNFDAAVAAMTQIVQTTNQISALDSNATVPASTLSTLFNEVDIFNANIHPELQTSIKLPPVGGILKQVPAALQNTTVGAFNVDPTTLGNSIGVFDAVAGSVTFQTFFIDKYDRVEISVRGVEITNTGVLQHPEIEDAFDSVNSGLSSSFAFVQQSNAIRLGTFNWRTFSGGYANALLTANFQSAGLLPSRGWYDALQSTIDYQLDVDQEPAGIEIVYAADAIEVGSEVWVCGRSGIIAIDETSYDVRKVFAHDFYIFNLVLVDTTVYALAEDGLYQIDSISGAVTKDVEIDLPSGFTSIFFINDNTLVGTPTNLVSRRPFDIQWHEQIKILDTKIIGNGVFTFVIGRDPANPTNGTVYYSTGGGSVWTNSASFPNTLINGVARRFDLIYFATNAGIYVEDLSGLFSNSNFSTAGIDLLDVEDDPDLSLLVQANDVAADNTRVVIGGSYGTLYFVTGGAITSVTSSLPAVHKVRLFGGKYWAFGYGLVQIEDAPTLIRLSTGKLLT